MCAERTTNSFFRAGSEPGSLATMLEDSTTVVWMTALALSETVKGKCGSGLRSLPRAAISAKVWPEPAKSCSAEAGVKTTPNFRPGVSMDSGSARSIEGWLRLAEMRDHGISMDAGLKIVMVPIAPASCSDFHRSPADDY